MPSAYGGGKEEEGRVSVLSLILTCSLHVEPCV